MALYSELLEQCLRFDEMLTNKHSYEFHLILHSCSNMCKTVKAILLSIYLAIFLHSIKYFLLDNKYDVVEYNYLVKSLRNEKKMQRELKKLQKNSTVMIFDFQRPKRFVTDLKYILQWSTGVPTFRFSSFSKGQRSFITSNCTYINCYLTTDNRLLPDIRHYDTILFDSENEWDKHPPLRAEHQNYILSTTDSSVTFPLCNEKYDNYYNLTWTYRLDSNIIRSRFRIMDLEGNLVGPKLNMHWISQMLPTSGEVKSKLKEKKIAAAWFIKNCNSINNMHINLVSNLNSSLSKANLTLDTYGWCGKFTCHRNRIEECLLDLRQHYYFYFSFEDSLSEDYVSEHLLYPLLNYAVPVVFGGANYSRFLPPRSYIDASILDTNEVASRIIRAIKNPKIYYEYFRWHNHYKYEEAPRDEGICDLCELLNNPIHNRREIKNIKKWWNPNFKKLCSQI